MLRLFIGVDVPPLASLCRPIDRLGRMGSSVRPVRPDAMHITLRFLGETDPRHIDPICHAMDAAVREAVDAGWLSPFDLLLTHIGTFPVKPDPTPRVVFAAPADPGPLTKLSDAIDEQLDMLGLPIAERDNPFHAHATLARIKRRRTPDRRVSADLPRLIEEARRTRLGKAPLKAVKLVESRIGPHGPDYTARHVSFFQPARE
ncbi:MAG: RNA 2',3'-cyclic phosphodiesterase [Phycisphaerales bacterium]